MDRGGGVGRAYRSYLRDDSVKSARLASGTLRRIVAFARPYRWQIAVFVALTTVSSLLVIASPLLLKQIIDRGVIPGERSVVFWLAIAVAGLAILEAIL